MMTQPIKSTTRVIPSQTAAVKATSFNVILAKLFKYSHAKIGKIIILYSGCHGLVFSYPSPIPGPSFIDFMMITWVL